MCSVEHVISYEQLRVQSVEIFLFRLFFIFHLINSPQHLLRTFLRQTFQRNEERRLPPR